MDKMFSLIIPICLELVVLGIVIRKRNEFGYRLIAVVVMVIIAMVVITISKLSIW